MNSFHPRTVLNNENLCRQEEEKKDLMWNFFFGPHIIVFKRLESSKTVHKSWKQRAFKRLPGFCTVCTLLPFQKPFSLLENRPASSTERLLFYLVQFLFNPVCVAVVL